MMWRKISKGRLSKGVGDGDVDGGCCGFGRFGVSQGLCPTPVLDSIVIVL